MYETTYHTLQVFFVTFPLLFSRDSTSQERMKYNKISEKDKLTIYEAYKNEEDWRSVDRTLKISTNTAYKWSLNFHVIQ